MSLILHQRSVIRYICLREKTTVLRILHDFVQSTAVTKSGGDYLHRRQQIKSLAASELQDGKPPMLAREEFATKLTSLREWRHRKPWLSIAFTEVEIVLFVRCWQSWKPWIFSRMLPGGKMMDGRERQFLKSAGSMALTQAEMLILPSHWQEPNPPRNFTETSDRRESSERASTVGFSERNCCPGKVL
jgi:hypothetical protein